MMWTTDEAPQLYNLDGGFIHEVVTIGETIYVFCRYPFTNKAKFRIFEFDPVYMKCYEVMHSLSNQLSLANDGHCCLHAISYGECIIIEFEMHSEGRSPKWYIIDTVTRQATPLEIGDGIPNINWKGNFRLAVVKDVLYVFEPSGEIPYPLVSAVNLKTKCWILNRHLSLSTPATFGCFSILAYETDIYCFHGIFKEKTFSGLFVFSTLSQTWTEIVNDYDAATDSHIIIGVKGIIINDRLVKLSHVVDEEQDIKSQIIDIYNMKTQKWTTLQFAEEHLMNSFHAAYVIVGGVSGACCAKDNKVIFITGSTNVYPNRHRFVNPQIRMLHLLPSLQTSCVYAIARHEVDISNVPNLLSRRMHYEIINWDM